MCVFVCVCVKRVRKKGRIVAIPSFPTRSFPPLVFCMSFIAFTPGLAEGEQEGSFLPFFELHGPCGLTWCECVLNSTTTTILQYSLPPSSLYFCQEFFTCMLYKKRGFFRGSVSFNKRSIYTSPPLPVLLSMTVDLAFLLGWGYEHQKLMILFRSMRKSF